MFVGGKDNLNSFVRMHAHMHVDQKTITADGVFHLGSVIIA
jgi:hypothetical protein